MNNRTIQNTELAFEAAIEMCIAATQQACAFSVAIGVVVLSPAGVELAAVRMNTAPLHALNIARKKAYTAASFKSSSLSWQEKLRHKPNTLSALLREENFTYLGGGIPIVYQDEIIGAIGISGATEQQDIECAEIAIKHLLTTL